MSRLRRARASALGVAGLAGVVLTGLLVISISPAQAATSLANEFLSSHTEATITSGTCNPSGDTTHHSSVRFRPTAATPECASVEPARKGRRSSRANTGLAVQVVTATVNVAAETVATPDSPQPKVSCPAGTKVTGGGFDMGSGTSGSVPQNMIVEDSQPDFSANGWLATAREKPAIAAQRYIRVWAVCMKLTP